MYITPERAEEVDFTDPEYQIGGALAVKAGNPLDLHSYEDIAANPDVKVATMAGSVTGYWQQAYLKTKLKRFDQPSVISHYKQAGLIVEL